MQMMLEEGHAEKAPEWYKRVWYVPHHGVYHPKKPEKLRVVFDCSADFQGHSLNHHLLQGPDLTNSLVGEKRSCWVHARRVAHKGDQGTRSEL